MSPSKRRAWTQDEDDIIRELVSEFGTKRWSLIAQLLTERASTKDKHTKSRTGKQCRERWHNHLDPGIKKNTWTKDEENTIFKYQRILGNKWSEIASHLPGRSDNSIKNHFYSTLRKKLRNYNRFSLGDERFNGSIKEVLQNHELMGELLNYPSSEYEIGKWETPRWSTEESSEDTEEQLEASSKPKTEAEIDDASTILCSLYDAREDSLTSCPSSPRSSEADFGSFESIVTPTMIIRAAALDIKHFDFSEPSQNQFSFDHRCGGSPKGFQLTNSLHIIEA
ncbi:unnamed protein product [Blepharisma stoltei]|uniref:Uncharacterized protein n=1 Tax=Blepharisma stoltei TaxID=1481888 RepID=A0AAU9I9A8_9CILI|nr:unnamed protein product [Blepharisma stoltei]